MPSINDKGEIIRDSQNSDEVNNIISQGNEQVQNTINQRNENIQNVINQGNEEFEKKYGYDLPAPDVNSDDPMVRQEALKHFQDQNKPFAPGENVPPQVAPAPIEGGKGITEESRRRQEDLKALRDQSNVGYGESVPQTTPEPVKVPENQLADLKPGQERFVQRKLNNVDESVNNNPLTELQRKLAEEQSKQQQEFAKDVQSELQQAEIKNKHEEELGKNAKANEGFKPLTPLSETGQSFFKKEDSLAEKVQGLEVKKSADYSTLPAEGIVPSIYKSEGGRVMISPIFKGASRFGLKEFREAFENRQVREDGSIVLTYLGGKKEGGEPTYSKDLIFNPEQIRKLEELLAHQDALDSNELANEGFKPLTPLSETGKNFFANQDKVAEDARIEAINKIQAQVDELNKRLEELRQGVVTPQQPPLPEEQEASAEVDVADDLESQLKELRREDTPEQRIVALDKQMKEILGDKELSELSDAEKLQFIDLSIERQKLAKEISAEVQESERKRIRKEKIVKIVAGVAGAGIALATPPVSIAAVVAITLGGRFATPLIRRAANSLRNRSEHLKYSDRSTATLEQLNDMDKRQRRNEWWANRLGEVAAVVSGGTAGYGLGKFAQALFGWQGITGAGNGPEVTQGDISGGQAKGPLGPEEASIGPDTPPVEPVTPPSGPETLPSDGVLVQNGRVDLPGSAWNGNLAGEAAGNLPGEALNYSNYTGGWHEMAPRMLENDLISNGLTRTQLLDNLGTPGTHQLLNEYLQAIQSGTADPNLVDALNNIGTEGAKNLLNIINK